MVLRDAGPSRWLKVVVLYDHDKGSIVTAFARQGRPLTITIPTPVEVERSAVAAAMAATAA